MEIILNTIKKYKIFAGFMLLIIIVLIGLLSKPSQQTSPNQTPVPLGPSWDSVRIGQSNLEDLKKQLGVPLTDPTDTSNGFYKFQSTSPNRQHEAKLNSGAVEFIKQIVTSKDGIKFSDLSTKYGTTSNILYNQDASANIALYVHPRIGVAYYGNPAPTADYVLEIWYFPPTTFEDFKLKWANEFSTEIPEEEFQF